MFLTQTMNPWFAVQRASQFLMILLAMAMLIMPTLDEPAEAQIGVTELLAVLAIVVGAGTALYVASDKPCGNSCGDNTPTSATHRVPCGSCRAYVWDCPNLSHPHQVGCGHCGSKYWDCPTSTQAYDHGPGKCAN